MVETIPIEANHQNPLPSLQPYSKEHQSNNRVSLLMRGLDASDWFEGSSLKVVDVLDQNGVSVSQFDLAVKEEKDESDNDGIEDVQ